MAEKLPVMWSSRRRCGLDSPTTTSRSQGQSVSRRRRSAAWVEAHIAGLERVGIERIAVFSGHGGNFAFIGELAAERTSRPGPTRVIAYDDLFGCVRVMDEAARG